MRAFFKIHLKINRHVPPLPIFFMFETESGSYAPKKRPLVCEAGATKIWSNSGLETQPHPHSFRIVGTLIYF